MTHPTENEIGLYVLDATRVTEDVRQHVAECGQCSQVADDIRSFETELANPANWSGISSTTEERRDSEDLRAFATRLEAEYSDAVEHLREYEHREAAAKFAAYGIANGAPLQTAGAVKRLCELANGMCERHPLYALTLAEAAVGISGRLAPRACPRNAIHELRGEAWKETANALTYLGRFSEALDALDRADEEFQKLSHLGAGILSARYVRAGVLLELERLDEAQRLVQTVAKHARRLGDEVRCRNSRHLLGIVEYERRDYASAAQVFEALLREAEALGDQDAIALASLAIGNCHVELGQPQFATKVLQRALSVYTAADIRAQVSRTRWAMARARFQMDEHLQAIADLQTIIPLLTADGMLTDAATAAVDLSEMLLAVGRAQQVPKVLAGVVRTFTHAGKLSGALAALAYLKDAATVGTISPAAIAHVRRFLRRADRQPALLFARPVD